MSFTINFFQGEIEEELVSWTSELYFKAWQRQVQKRCDELRNTVLLNNKQEKSEENFKEDKDNRNERKGSSSEGVLCSSDVLFNSEQECVNDSFEENFEEDIYNENTLSEGLLAKFDEEMSEFNSGISDLVRIKILTEPKYP